MKHIFVEDLSVEQLKHKYAKWIEILKLAQHNVSVIEEQLNKTEQEQEQEQGISPDEAIAMLAFIAMIKQILDRNSN